MAQIMISGPPGAGKSHFCEWLRDTKGYVWLPFDFATDEVRRFLCAQSLAEAANVPRYLRALGDHVAVEWGFLPEQLSCVKRLRAAGFAIWWLDGPTEACRVGYQERWGSDPVRQELFELQVARIAGMNHQLTRLYAGRTILSVKSGLQGPVYTCCEDIAAVVLS
jgi:hypothetical protein